jgi:uncharacterized RDD family membrane protein YckC
VESDSAVDSTDPEETTVEEPHVAGGAAGIPENGASESGEPESNGQRSITERIMQRGAKNAQRVVDAAGLDQAIETAVEEAIVRAIESEATEKAIARILNGPLIEQAVTEALKSPEVEKAIIEVLDSQTATRVWDHVLEGPHAQRLVERVAEAPEVRAAIAAQGIGLIGDLGYQVSRVTRVIDFIGERVVRRILFRPQRETPTARVGFFTRALGIGVDLIIVNAVIALLGAIISGLSDSIGITNGQQLPAAMLAVGGILWFVVASLYLVVFWSLSGQTIGMRFLDIRMERDGSFRIGSRAAWRRLVGFWISAMFLGLPFLAVLIKTNRRGLHDRMGDTTVYFIDPAHPDQPHEQPVLKPKGRKLESMTPA